MRPAVFMLFQTDSPLKRRGRGENKEYENQNAEKITRY